MSINRAADLLALRTAPDLTAHDWDRLTEAYMSDPDSRVRTAALTVITERGDDPRFFDALRVGATDVDPAVRRRAGELAAMRPLGSLGAALLALLVDPDATVADAAAAALGECPFDDTDRASAVTALARAGTEHADALVRESAIAALGSIGDARGLPAILHGCTDKPTIRRRAVLALAPFDGPEVEAAIDRALTDRDWQTRQAAELLREAR